MRVIVHNEANAEDNAMLQALYSRSSSSVMDHVEKLREVGSGKFMDVYYIGYGHASVGDLGAATVYFEGISMLAAKAIQDNQLYNGQECSSRYIDFGSAKFLPGVWAPGERQDQVESVLTKMRAFYVNNLEKVVSHVARNHPRQETESESTYAKAVKARAFDILRGYLPCGATTNVAWTGTLRNLRERLELLMHHPLYEVKLASAMAYKELYAKYPHSFVEGYASTFNSGLSNLVAIEGEEPHAFLSRQDHFYSDVLVTSPEHGETMDISSPEEPLMTGLPTLSLEVLEAVTTHLKGRRPPRHSGAEHCRLAIEAMLDFGSFRDLQRHRGGYCSMPAVDPLEGFHAWYYHNLPSDVQDEAARLLDEIKDLDYKLISEDPSAIRRLMNQYFMPMGCLVPCSLEYSLPQAIYVAELRSGQTVHSTLRPLAQQLGDYLSDHGVEVHFDDRPDTWSTRRGTQDIVDKSAETPQE